MLNTDRNCQSFSLHFSATGFQSSWCTEWGWAVRAQQFWLNMRHSAGQYTLHTYLQGCPSFIRLQVEIFYRLACSMCCVFDWRSSGVWIYPSLLNYSSIAKRGWNLVLGYYIQSYCEHLYTPLCLDVCIQVLENLKKNCFFSEEIIFSHLRLAVFLSTVSFD